MPTNHWLLVFVRQVMSCGCSHLRSCLRPCSLSSGCMERDCRRAGGDRTQPGDRDRMHSLRAVLMYGSPSSQVWSFKRGRQTFATKFVLSCGSSFSLVLPWWVLVPSSLSLICFLSLQAMRSQAELCTRCSIPVAW